MILMSYSCEPIISLIALAFGCVCPKMYDYLAKISHSLEMTNFPLYGLQALNTQGKGILHHHMGIVYRHKAMFLAC